MTEEQIEFFKHQTFITMNDLARIPSGKYIIKREAMNRIAASYGLSLPEGKLYLVTEARDIILKAEEAKKKKVETQQPLTEVEEVVQYLKSIPKEKREEVHAISQHLVEEFSHVRPSEMKEAISLSNKGETLFDTKALFSAYNQSLSLKKISDHLEELSKARTSDDSFYFNANNYLKNFYKHGVPYGQLRFALMQSSLKPQDKQNITTFFYQSLIDEIENRYKETKLRGSLLAKDILAHYRDFDMAEIYDMIERRTSIPKEHISYAKFKSYQIEDEKDVKELLIEANRDRKSAKDIYVDLVDYFNHLEYPFKYSIKTLESMESAGLVLPYKDLYTLINYKIVDQVEKKEDILKKNEQSVVPPKNEKETTEEPTVKPIVSKVKKHKVVSREKSIKAAERKSVISCLVVASGAISTAVLTTIFGVNPIVAAKNCFASISSFTAGSPAFSQMLPNSKEFIEILAAAGMTFVGTIAWLKNSHKLKKLGPSDSLEEEEKGGKTR